jgi:large-conductance mechanosensitive channel
LSGLFLAAALFAPKLLRPMNRVWFKFGLLLHHIINPLVMGLLFFLTVTPVAILMRLSGKDPLRLKSAPAARSYWIPRPPSGPASTTMKRQF